MPEAISLMERGVGTPLVLVHGSMVTGEVFRPLLDTLSRQHRVIVPDLRGHGQSRHRHLPPPLSAVQHAADLAALLDSLSVKSADVLGYSQGGTVAQQFALDFPARCRRLVLVCTWAYNMATLQEWMEGKTTPLSIRLLGMRRFGALVVSKGSAGPGW